MCAANHRELWGCHLLPGILGWLLRASSPASYGLPASCDFSGYAPGQLLLDIRNARAAMTDRVEKLTDKAEPAIHVP